MKAIEMERLCTLCQQIYVSLYVSHQRLNVNARSFVFPKQGPCVPYVMYSMFLCKVVCSLCKVPCSLCKILCSLYKVPCEIFKRHFTSSQVPPYVCVCVCLVLAFAVAAD